MEATPGTCDLRMVAGPDRATVEAVALLPRSPNPTAALDRANPAPVVHEANGLRRSLHPDGSATLTPLPGAHVHTGHVRDHLEYFRDAGIRRVTTSALNVRDAPVWEAAGLRPATELVLLRVDLRRAVAAPPRERDGTRRRRNARRREWGALADIDTAAFAPQPGLGIAGLLDAIAVTPAARIRVAGRPALGFVITGHDLRSGYVQRLAVAPHAEGRGIGSALLADTLRWLQRRRAVDALVNTESTNGRALALYERFGFVRQPDGLVVLEWQP